MTEPKLPELQITLSDNPVTKPTFLAYPKWLTLSNKGFREVYKDTLALNDSYNLFFITQNEIAQRALARNVLIKLESIRLELINESDYSAESNAVSKEAIEKLNLEWLESIKVLTSLMAESDFGITVTVKDGEAPNIRVGDSFAAMVEGKLREDFLYNHPSCEQAFTSFSLARWAEKVGAIKALKKLSDTPNGEDTPSA